MINSPTTGLSLLRFFTSLMFGIANTSIVTLPVSAGACGVDDT